MPDLFGPSCPLCDGIGQLPPALHESALEALAARMGFRLERAKAKRQAPQDATDWTPVIAALSAARVDLGFGPAIYTGSPKQLAILRAHSVADWPRAIEAQRSSLDESLLRRSITRHQASTYLSLETIGRNFDRCLQNANDNPEQPPHQLPDGRWAQQEGPSLRILTTEECCQLGLAPPEP